MRRSLQLGPANFALVAIYFVPVWGVEALRALTSPFAGLADRPHAAAAVAIRNVFDFGIDGLMRTANVLAAVKFVVAAAFAAYLIEFVRALVADREPNRETLDAVLLLAVGAIVLFGVPALALDDGALVRLHATQLLLVLSAVIVITVERHVEQTIAPRLKRAAVGAGGEAAYRPRLAASWARRSRDRFAAPRA